MPFNNTSSGVRSSVLSIALAASTAFLTAAAARGQVADTPLRVCATISDLGSLVQEIGGDAVAVEVFAKPTEDPHFVEAKPGFIKALSQADLFVLSGLELEIGWVPPLLSNARNANVLSGAPGNLDAGAAITPLDLPTGPIDRSMGDVHPSGNPHYLLDPLNGLKVAQLIRDRLTTLRPGRRELFEERFKSFRERLGTALVGADLAKKYDFEKLATLFEHGKLLDFLKSQKDEQKLSGWLGTMQPFYGSKAVSDHNMWPYFAKRFGLAMVGSLEPKPGVPPTTKHLSELVARAKAEGVRVILASPYYDPKHAEFLAAHTGAKVAHVAHLVGSREGTADYLATTDYNVRQVVAALRGGS